MTACVSNLGETEGKIRGIMESPSEYMVPFWNPGSEGVRVFIDQLEEAKILGIFENEGKLIYAALCKSNKPEIYSQLSTEEKASIQKFAMYLAQNFGDTPNELKRKFQQMRQNDRIFSKVYKGIFRGKIYKRGSIRSEFYE